MKKHNFSAGPSILPREVIEETAKAILDFNGSGLSVLEVSHRGKDFQAVMDEAVALFKEILNIPEGYSVLFLGGGASMQFCMVPYNFLEKKAAYLNTGVWAKKAMKEAKGFGEVVEVASSADANYTFIPKDFTIPADADYFHVTTNNTIYGTELKGDLDSPVPMVADMSSDIFSRPVDVSKYICIYGGAQKNLAPSGVTFVIVKDDAVGKVSRYIPSMLNYKTHIDGGSMFNRRFTALAKRDMSRPAIRAIDRQISICSMCVLLGQSGSAACPISSLFYKLLIPGPCRKGNAPRGNLHDKKRILYQYTLRQKKKQPFTALL